VNKFDKQIVETRSALKILKWNHQQGATSRGLEKAIYSRLGKVENLQTPISAAFL
jgi:hypothetical protein